MLIVFNAVKRTLNGSSGGSVLGATSPARSINHYYKYFMLWSLAAVKHNFPFSILWKVQFRCRQCISRTRSQQAVRGS